MIAIGGLLVALGSPPAARAEIAPVPAAPAAAPLAADSAAGCAALVSPQADRLLAPLLREEALGYAAELDTTGRLAADSVHAQRADTLFHRLLESRSEAADEALAALARVYVGDAEGEELSCELQERGARVLPHLRRFVLCLPRGAGWTVPAELVLEPDFARDDLTSIELGETCEDE
jgi:hypothetical protein